MFGHLIVEMAYYVSYGTLNHTDCMKLKLTDSYVWPGIFPDSRM